MAWCSVFDVEKDRIKLNISDYTTTFQKYVPILFFHVTLEGKEEKMKRERKKKFEREKSRPRENPINETVKIPRDGIQQ